MTESLASILHRQEDLLPELQRYLEQEPKLGLILRHPLVYSVPHTAQLNAFVNWQFLHRKKKIQEARANRQWGRILALHERPYRPEALRQLAPELDDLDYWSFVGEIWRDTENSWQCRNVWIQLFKTQRAGRENMMDAEERQILAALPDSLTVWRGISRQEHAQGFSWTLSRSRAHWFACRFRARNAEVLEGRIAKKDVLAYFKGRGEDEILALPEHVQRASLA